MNALTKIICFAVVLCTCNRLLAEDSLIGLWRGESLTNATVEFWKDGSFHMDTVSQMQGKQVILPLNGSYKIADTNHIILEVAFNALAPSRKTPFKLAYQLSGDKLQMQTIDVEWGVINYHRVKK